jgi:glucose/galactose transporter
MAVGSLLFIPAASVRSFPFFLTALFVQFTGMALLQTASNPYITVVGPLESAARRISIMGICNKVAGALSPLVVGAIVLKNATALEVQVQATTDAGKRAAILDQLAGRVVVPYVVMAGILVLLALMIKKSSLPEIQMDGAEEKAGDGMRSGKVKKSVFDFPHLLLGVICIFTYVGVEVLAGDGIGTFGKAMGMPLDQTKYFTTFTLVAMLAGYIVGIIAIPRYLSQSTALRLCAILGLVFGLGILFSTGYVAITFIALLGLANSLMWPAIWPLALEGLGKFTKSGSALLIMGIVGGAIVPPLYGALKDNLHLQNNIAFCVCLFPCYVYILYYAFSGSKVGLPAKVEVTKVGLVEGV